MNSATCPQCGLTWGNFSQPGGQVYCPRCKTKTTVGIAPRVSTPVYAAVRPKAQQVKAPLLIHPAFLFVYFCLSIFLISKFIVFVSTPAGYMGTAESSDPLSAQRFDPKSTTEENRQMLRDKMIEQGTDPAAADAFTSELYKAEREHRRAQGLPE